MLVIFFIKKICEQLKSTTNLKFKFLNFFKITNRYYLLENDNIFIGSLRIIFRTSKEIFHI